MRVAFLAYKLRLPIWLALLGLLCLPLAADRAQAQSMARFDFEPMYFVHPGLQTWDFSLIREAGTYHIFYHTAKAIDQFNSTGADTIRHATSNDLRHWNLEVPVIAAGQGVWDTTMTWAPDVFRDEANNRWGIAYTGVDTSFNQRICFAFSSDLYNWAPAGFNPTITPESGQYIWSTESTWGNFRDPYIYRENDQWHILVTARKFYSVGTGVLYHGVSDDLENWVDVGVFFKNDGAEPGLELESPQYRVWGNYHYLLFGEFDTGFTTAIMAQDPDSLSMGSRIVLDYGYAPEVDSFDAGVDIYSRLAVFRHPQTDVLNYVIRLDTLLVSPAGDDISVHRPHPLAASWELLTGVATLAAPTFGDNPSFRGDAPVGVVGNGYFGSAEYYQGPLSGRGGPGTKLGDTTTGELRSFPFMVQGGVIDLLVGGGDYPTTCYVALMDAVADTIIFFETGQGEVTMTPRQWSLYGLTGREVYIKIVDAEYGAMGFINVDEIIESGLPAAALDIPSSGGVLVSHGAYPNPFNPVTQIQFSLTARRDVQVKIYDMRGRQVWRSGVIAGEQGLNRVTWRGVDTRGQQVATGGYLYSLQVDGAVPVSGKLLLVK